MTQNNASLSSLISVLKPAPANPPPATITVNQEIPADDFEYARQNIKDVISTGQQAMAEIANLAGQTQTARAYEVLTGLMDTLVNASGELLELSKKQKDLKQEKTGPETVNNSLFVGSTTDLQRMLDEMRKEKS